MTQRGRRGAAARDGWALLSTVIVLAAAAALLAVWLNGWWTMNHATTLAYATVQDQAQSQAAVAYGVWWLEQDPAAAHLNTSTPAVTLAVPPPANAPAASVRLALQDPVAAVTPGAPVTTAATSGANSGPPGPGSGPGSGGPGRSHGPGSGAPPGGGPGSGGPPGGGPGSGGPGHGPGSTQAAPAGSVVLTASTTGSLTVQVGTTWALTAVGTDADGHQVSLNDLTLNWQAAGTGSTPGAVQWVAPGVFQATAAGTVAISVPSVTTQGGQTLPVTTSSVTVTITSGPPGTASGLTVSPGTATLTLGATQPLTAVYTAANGQQASVTSGTWAVSSGSGVVSLQTTATGATVTALAPGTATVSCTYTPAGGSPVTVSATLQVVDPIRVVQIVPEGAPPDAAVTAVVEAQGPTVQVLSWTTGSAS